tara:strand:- start:632 stop:808 length:177 start_codon:yes stop_codon:yes gene_type:complete
MKKLFYAEFEPIVKKSSPIFVAKTIATGEAKNKKQFIKKIKKEIESDKKIVFIMEIEK